jgi:hypothetical protein
MLLLGGNERTGAFDGMWGLGAGFRQVMGRHIDYRVRTLCVASDESAREEYVNAILVPRYITSTRDVALLSIGKRNFGRSSP